MCEIDHRKGLWVKNSIVLASKHCAYMSRSAPAKAAKYIAASIHWGKYCGHCFKKGCGGKLPAPLEKIGRFAQTKGKFGSIMN